MTMPSALENALRLVAQHGQKIEGDWWIIGSTAALLAGFDDFQPADIDLVGSFEVMTAFVEAFGCKPVQTFDHQQFRSNPFQRVQRFGVVPIEVMGGLEVFANGHWNRLVLKTRIEISGFGSSLWIPSVDEQIAVLELFGRPKDLAKAKVMQVGAQ